MGRSHRDLEADRGVGVVALEPEAGEQHLGVEPVERLQVLRAPNLGIDDETGLHAQLEREPRPQPRLVVVLGLAAVGLLRIDVGVDQGVGEVARLDPREAPHQLEQEGVAGDVVGHAERDVGAPPPKSSGVV